MPAPTPDMFGDAGPANSVDVGAAMDLGAPPTTDAPMGDPDAAMEGNDSDPQFAADAADLFPKFSPEQLGALQALIDSRCEAMKSKESGAY